MTPWVVRDERAGEDTRIAGLIEAAFRRAPHADGSEPAIVERLRRDGDLALSLVVDGGEGGPIGHVAFSPVAVGDGTMDWYGLGPVSVLPRHQRRGIGSALVLEGLRRLRERSAGGCVVLGEPAFYGRFGFRHDPRLTLPGPPAEYFQALLFAGPEPVGDVRYARAFG